MSYSNNVKTTFTRNVNPVNSHTVKNKFIGTIQFATDDIYTKLAIFTKKIDYLFRLFSQGQFSQIVLLFQREDYNQLALELLNLAAPSNDVYEQIRSTIAKSLEGLYQGILQYIVLINTEYELVKYKEKASILDDMCKLREYLEHMKETLCILPDREVSIVSASVKPEYLEYIRRYGYPEGGIFEMDRLADVLNSL